MLNTIHFRKGTDQYVKNVIMLHMLLCKYCLLEER